MTSALTTSHGLGPPLQVLLNSPAAHGAEIALCPGMCPGACGCNCCPPLHPSPTAPHAPSMLHILHPGTTLEPPAGSTELTAYTRQAGWHLWVLTPRLLYDSAHFLPSQKSPLTDDISPVLVPSCVLTSSPQELLSGIHSTQGGRTEKSGSQHGSQPHQPA